MTLGQRPQPAAPGTSESGLGVALNQSGQVVVASNGGIFSGRLDDDTLKAWTDQSGQMIRPGTSQSSLGVGLNQQGQAIVASNGGIFRAQLK